MWRSSASTRGLRRHRHIAREQVRKSALLLRALPEIVFSWFEIPMLEEGRFLVEQSVRRNSYACYDTSTKHAILAVDAMRFQCVM